MVRLGDFKLTIEDDDCHPAMLFNVADDPYEQQNLIEDPAHADTLAELLQVVTQWRQGCLGFRQAGEAG